MKLYVVMDTYEMKEGCIILGIFTDSNQALILQQKCRREVYNANKNSPAAREIDRVCEAICIKEFEADTDYAKGI